MSNKRSLLLQLPRDILHTIYSEWLSSWRDLSCLDVGCVGEGDRESWLSSLSELMMSEGLDFSRLSDECVRRWYEWVISRKVYLVERFPLNLRVLPNLTAELDYRSYCPALRSIDLQYHSNEKACPVESKNVWNVLEERLYLFLRECSHLEEVKYIECDVNSAVRDVVFSALTAGLEANTLQRISIAEMTDISTSEVILIRQFLAKHLSSMHDVELMLPDASEESVDGIMSILDEKTTPLKKLSLCADIISLHTLLRYLSPVASNHLQVLRIETVLVLNQEDFMKGEIFSYLSKACPQLRTLTLKKICSEGTYQVFDQFPVRKLLELYQSCPNLIAVAFFSIFYVIFIEADEDKSELRFNTGPIYLCSIVEKELFLECLCLAIQRSPCKLSVSNYSFCDNLVRQHDDWLLFKSKLSPYLTDLVGVMSEPILIKALKDLPRLEKLEVKLEEERFSDLSLAAIIEHGYELKILCIFSVTGFASELCNFSDEMISKVIENCKLLEELRIPGAGYESILAVKHHSWLRELRLDDVKVEKEEISRLLLANEREGEKGVVWRLQTGEIFGTGYRFCYFKGKRCWECSDN